MGRRKGVRITATSPRSATTRCFCSTTKGDCLAASLRPGNVPSADDWDDLLVPEIDRQQATRAGRLTHSDWDEVRPGEKRAYVWSGV